MPKAPTASPGHRRRWTQGPWPAPARVQSPADYFRDHGIPPTGPELAGAWSVFTLPWHPPGPGTYKLGCRAIDDHGTVQLPDNDPAVRGHFNQTRIKWRTVRVPEQRSLPGPVDREASTA